MLGPPKPRRLDQPIAVSLEDLVPRDHFYRHLEAKLDLSFVRDWARELYAERGRPSIDPVVFFKLQLVMFFEGIRSERQLIETARLNLAHRWYLGYALDEALPDHSSLTRIRQRLGIDVFERFFEKIVDLCQEAGLVWGRELYFDATKVEANAGIPSLVPRFYYDAKTHVADLFADERPTDDAPTSPDTDLPTGIVQLPIDPESVPSAGRSALAAVGGAAARSEPPSPCAATGARATCGSAPPIRMPRRCGTGARSASATTTTTSSMAASARIILAALVTPADVMENQADAGPAVAGLLPPEDLAPPSDRRRQVRHHREHRRHRGRRHPRLRPADRTSSTARRFSAGTCSPTTPSGTTTAARKGSRFLSRRSQADRGSRRLPRRPGHLQCLSTSRPSAPTSDHGRTIQRSFYEDYLDQGAGLPHDRGVQEGDPQAPGLGRATVR